MRVVVQRTFFELVDESTSQLLEGAVKRALSAPVAPSRANEPPSSRQDEEEAKCPESPLDVAQRAPSAEGRVGQEPKTTVAIRNIPLHFTRDQLQQHLDAGGSAGQYDFLYLPINFAESSHLAECRNFGYCFVNLTTPERARRIFAEFDGVSWGHPSEGKAVVSWSLAQGIDSHTERYRNSPVMHESVLDACKPIVLEGGVRVDFPPPTQKVQRLRRLRSRCGSRGRGVPPSGICGIHDMEAQQVGDVPGTPAGTCTLLPGLLSAPSGADRETGVIAASPLLAGLRRASTEASPVALGQRREKMAEADLWESEALSECSSQAAASPREKAALADLQDDLDDGCSVCSTLALGYSSGALSSDGSGGLSDSLAASRRGSVSSARPWCGSMLAKGLMPTLPEEKDLRPPGGSVIEVVGSLIEIVGAYPTGAHAVITAVDCEKGTYNVQPIQDGRRTRRLRTVKWKHARFLRHAEVGP